LTRPPPTGATVTVEERCTRWHWRRLDVQAATNIDVQQ
jgi:hypothetical protein